MGTVQPVQHLVLYQFVRIAIFMSLAGTCIAVASASPIHVPPIQHVLKHCRTHIILIYYMK